MVRAWLENLLSAPKSVYDILLVSTRSSFLFFPFASIYSQLIMPRLLLKATYPASGILDNAYAQRCLRMSTLRFYEKAAQWFLLPYAWLRLALLVLYLHKCTFSTNDGERRRQRPAGPYPRAQSYRWYEPVFCTSSML